MYGGILNSNNQPIIPNTSFLSNKKIVICFGTCLYLFDKLTQQCLAQINIGHTHNIIATHYDPQLNILVSVDNVGKCIISSLQFEDTNKKSISVAQDIHHALAEFTINKNVKKTNSKTKQDKQGIIDVSDARIALLNKRLIIHYLYTSKFYRCEFEISGIKNNSNKKSGNYEVVVKSNRELSPGVNFSKISFHRLCSTADEDLERIFMGVIDQSEKYLYILNESFDGQPKYWEYTHHEKITSSELQQSEQTLIIGDAKGKIYVLNGYLSGKVYTRTKLEWHTSPVSTLTLSNNYLYSAGEESVVVLWHLQDFSRDFLPRVGTPILSVKVIQQTNQVLCYLSNNSLKLIDLSSDKQLYNYQLLLDRNGYYAGREEKASNLYAYNLQKNTLCLPSVSSRLQFLKLNRSTCTELQIFNRNLTSRLDQQMPMPHQIISFAFSDDHRWEDLLVAIEGKHGHSSLKFFRSKIGVDYDYQLVTKIQNPHTGPIAGSYSLGDQKYLTYSQNDHEIKIWSQQKQKKKSIIQTDILYWKCQRIVSYRGLKPKSISCWSNYFAIAYQNQVIVCQSNLAQFGNKDQFRSFEQNVSNSISSINLLNQELLFIVREDLTTELWYWKNSTKQPRICFKIEGSKLASPIKIYSNNSDRAALVLQTKQKSQIHQRILTLDFKTRSLTESYTLNQSTAIQSAFWYNAKNLVLVLDNLTLQSLKPNSPLFFSMSKQQEKQISNYQDTQMEEEKYSVTNQNQIDIFTLNERWGIRKAAQKNSNVDELIQNMHLMPSCDIALSSIWNEVLQ